MKNWKTTALGIVTIISALSVAAKQWLSGGVPDLSVLLPAIASGVGLISAKDGE